MKFKMRSNKSVLIISIILLLFICLTFNIYAAPLDNWYFSNYFSMNGKSLSAVTIGNNIYVVVGATGTILTSSDDGSSWINRNSGTTEFLNSVIYGNKMFVVVGSGGIILTSDDGISWASKTSGITNDLLGITFGNNTFVAIGDSGIIMTSSDDGISWASKTSGITNDLLGITFGNNTFVAVGDKGTIVTSSDDGVSWTNITSGTINVLWGVAFGNNIFVAVGTRTIVTSSDDGISWTNIISGITNGLYGVTYGNNTFVAVGDSGTIVTSSDDGVLWINRPSVTGFYGLYGVTYGNYVFMVDGLSYSNSTFMGVGSNGIIIQSATVIIFPIISVSSADLNFDSVNIGNVLSNKRITVNNIGSSDLIVNTARITGTNANEFSIKNDNCSGQTISPSTSRTLDIFFSPISEGQKTANLLIPSNDTTNINLIVPLNGIGFFDTTLPFVISTNPKNNATEVTIDIAITAAFSEKIDFLTINDTTFTVIGVTGSVNYDAENKIATFIPSNNLGYKTTYTVIISKSIKDIAGNSMDLDYAWNFTTGNEPDMILPKIISVSPLSGAVNVPARAVITATFSEPMNVASINNNNFTVNGITGVVTYDSTQVQAKFTPSGDLAENTTYLVIIKTGVKDISGNPIKQQYTWSFTISNTNSPGKGKKGCLISRIAHNVNLDKYMYVLTRFRDRYLSNKIMYKNKITAFYYTIL